MEARYLKSVYKIEESPQDHLVEVAIAGKSNVGKSTLLNRLTGRRQLAKTSATPGKTRCLNYFLIEPGKTPAFYLVDLPGYGYAKVSKAMRKDWGELIEQYLNGSERLAGLVALFDARRDPTEEDKDWLAWLGKWEKASFVVLTKCDKLSRSERVRSLDRWGQASPSRIVPPVLFSSTTGEGKDRLWQWIDDVRLAQIRRPKNR
jgi:GTP-binding protein